MGPCCKCVDSKIHCPTQSEVFWISMGHLYPKNSIRCDSLKLLKASFGEKTWAFGILYTPILAISFRTSSLTCIWGSFECIMFLYYPSNVQHFSYFITYWLPQLPLSFLLSLDPPILFFQLNTSMTVCSIPPSYGDLAVASSTIFDTYSLCFHQLWLGYQWHLIYYPHISKCIPRLSVSHSWQLVSQSFHLPANFMILF